MFQIFPTARLRPSPFFNSIVAEGCTSVSIYNRMILPASFGDKEKEYWDLINGVVTVSYTHLTLPTRSYV